MYENPMNIPLLRTDSYKLSHKFLQDSVTNAGITKMYSNFTNRGSRLSEVDHVVFYGLQAWLEDLSTDFDVFFFNKNIENVLWEYRNGIDGFVDLSKFDDSHIRELHALGYLPLEVRAVREGTPVPTRIPSMTIENTHPDFAWLVNYLESWLSSAIWHPSTNATTAWMMRRKLDNHALETSGQCESVDFQFHDFSLRGMSNWQSAATSGSAHLIPFRGSDNVPAKAFIEKYYPGEDNGFLAGSVVASEHSIMVLNGREEELETYRRLIKDNPTGILSLVSDTYNLWNVVTEILPALKDDIMSRDGRVVIRPDSGNPADIVCGLDKLSGSVGWSEGAKELAMDRGSFPQGEQTPEGKGVIELLWDVFGGTVNEQGYRELDPHIGVIYGDSINPDNADEIVERLKSKGFASTNIVFGAGSFFYNGAVGRDESGNFVVVTRDTFASAVKATWAEVDGEGVDLIKDPITDNGTKKSATGRLAVLSQMDGRLYLVEQATPEQEAQSLLEPVWRDGKFLRTQSFNEVRQTLVRWTGILERNGSVFA